MNIKKQYVCLKKAAITQNDIYTRINEENDVEPYGNKEVRKSNVQNFDFQTLMILILAFEKIMI